LLLIAKNLDHADTRIVEKHHGHLAWSYIVDAICADAPKFGFTPNASVVPLRGERWRSAAVHEVLVAQPIGRGIRRMSQRITLHS
jgi:hypothetical protein